MGIPSYFSHIVRKYSQIVGSMEKNKNIHYDNLFMDCNSIIYDILRTIEFGSEFESELIEAVILKIEGYIQEIKPSNDIFIAFDGVAPFAKMNQQKTRRYRSSFMANNEYLGAGKKTWSTSNITPGTNFMNALSERINYFFFNKESEYKVKNIIVSASDKPGEGEHKLFEYLRQCSNKQHNMALYGLDADLIMLAMFHIEYQNNIFIFREAPAFITKSDSNELYILDIKFLCNSIHSEMSCKFPHNQRIYDYSFMCFLLGNDFLPHFPALNIRTHGIPVLLDLYREIIGNYPNRFLTKDGEIQWRWVSVFITELAKSEYQFIIEEYNVREKNNHKRWVDKTPKDREMILNDIPIMYRSEEKYICPKEKFWEKRYYTCLFEPNLEIKNLCNNYLEGLEWVFNYYTGVNVNWKWKYNYHYPPLLKDLQNYVPHFKVRFLDENKTPFSPILQLIYVLPATEYHLLPKSVVTYISKNYPQLINPKCEFQWAFCRYFWENHVCFPEIDVKTLEKIENEIQLKIM